MCAAKHIRNLTRNGMTACNEGRFNDALFQLTQALDLARNLGSAVYEAKIRTNLGLVYQLHGQPDIAASHLQIALRKVEQKIGRDNRLFNRIENSLNTLAA